MINPFQKIGVLGEGVTGKAVQEKAKELSIQVVPVEEANIVIASPGIPPKSFPKIAVPIISELDYAYLLLQHYAPETQIIAVTGTNGKSTVTSLIAHLLDCPAVGNIGVPLISVLSPSRSEPIICVEVSSYQLETTQYFQANVAVLLNVVEDHLVRHGTMAKYVAQKQRLIEPMTADSIVFYNSNDENLREMVACTQAMCIPFESAESISKQLSEEWQRGHYPLNAVAGNMVARYYNESEAAIIKKFATFKFLPHRLEEVSRHTGRQFINDSKATNPHATLNAVAAFEDPVHVILCGEDKRYNAGQFLAKLNQKVKSITVFGNLSSVIMPLADTVAAPITHTATLADAVQIAYKASEKNEVILFSPSSSSYDQFNGFKDRGDQFKAYVKAQFCKTH